jgi:osmoprotectant transport system substrate-binding protein
VKQGTLRLVIAALAALLLAVGFAACGSDDDDATAGGGTGTAASTTAAELPGEGKPPVTIGTKNFTEQFVLGQLYKQALEARGFTVAVKENIGSTELIERALRSGQIDLFPEYVGIFNTAIAGDARAYDSAEDAFAAAQAFGERQGWTLLPLTPFTDTDALAVLPEYAEENGLRSVGDLARIRGLRLGAPPEFRERATGLVGLRDRYGISDVDFSPLTIGLQYQALDNRQIDVANVFTTDGQLEGGRYVVLDDPENVFGFQNVTPVVTTETIEREGPAFEETLNLVSEKLTTEAMQQMNAAVAIDRQSPEEVARQFLEANGLL